MTFIEDNNLNTIETLNPKWEKVELSLKLIDPKNKSFFVLTNDLQSYVQCAGGKDRLTIELREYVNSNEFKHYVIGKNDKLLSSHAVWTQIDCRVGPIRIQETEVLNLNDVIDVFNAFFYNKNIPEIYSMRNVTKQFKK